MIPGNILTNTFNSSMSVDESSPKWLASNYGYRHLNMASTPRNRTANINASNHLQPGPEWNESAVDVPVSFVERIKTQPRYNPHTPYLRRGSSRYRIRTKTPVAINRFEVSFEDDSYSVDDASEMTKSSKGELLERLRSYAGSMVDEENDSFDELLENSEVRRIVSRLEESQIKLDFHNGSMKFKLQEIMSQCILALKERDKIPSKYSDRTSEITTYVPNLKHCGEFDLSSEIVNLASAPHIQLISYQEFEQEKRKVYFEKSHEVDENLLEITIEKTYYPLGLTIFNEGRSVKIGRIVYGGTAAKSGLFREGDEILSVNGIDIRMKPVKDVYTMLGGIAGPISFVVAPAVNNHSALQPKYKTLHLKAHFDYDPESDLQLPCRDLGIGFKKGDILHVTDQRDPNWWQAYRDDEYDETLAGLIPSIMFQTLRETVTQSLKYEEGLQNTKTPKKIWEKFISSRPSGTKQAEVSTYEKVALYLPRNYFQRPVALIGPPNTGRRDLSQRFMKMSERFATAVAHTTRTKHRREVDAEDFHFISKSQFKANISAKKFLEYGKYNSNYYGTTYDSIWAVVKAGKTCLLNINVLSLEPLRNSGLMPYVVLVAPSSLERMILNKNLFEEPCEDEELEKIIEEAIELKAKYGQYIDMVVYNTDTESTFLQIVKQLNLLAKEPQWVPASWLNTED